MANANDLEVGRDRDDLLKQLDDIPGYKSADSHVATATGLLWLDEQFGLAMEGDYLLVEEGWSYWLLLLVVPADPEIRLGLDFMDPEVEERVKRSPFNVKFTCPDGPEFDTMFPESIRGKTVLMRVMTDEEVVGIGVSALTVRADGTPINLPDSSQTPA